MVVALEDTIGARVPSKVLLTVQEAADAMSLSRSYLYELVMQDTNRGRWSASPFWQAVQAADFLGDPTPLVRERRRVGDLRLICQMIAGCSTTAAAFLAGELPQRDDGTHFLIWFSTWLERYLAEKRVGFEAIRDHKRVRLGVVIPGQAA